MSVSGARRRWCGPDRRDLAPASRSALWPAGPGPGQRRWPEPLDPGHGRTPGIAASCRCTYRTAVGASGERSASRRASSRSAGNAVARDGDTSGLEVELFLGVAALQEQLEELGGAGQPAERDRPQLVRRSVRVAWGDDLGDPGHGGLDPDRVTGLDPADHGAQPELVGARGRDVAAAAFGLDAFVVQGRVGLDDLGLGHGEDPAGGLAADDPGHRPVHDPDRRRAGGGTASRPGARGRGRPRRSGTAPRRPGAGASDPGCPRSRSGSPSLRPHARARSHPGTAPAPTACPHHRPAPAGRTDPSAHRNATPPTAASTSSSRTSAESTSPHRLRRSSQQARRVEVGQVVVHEGDARGDHRQPEAPDPVSTGVRETFSRSFLAAIPTSSSGAWPIPASAAAVSTSSTSGGPAGAHLAEVSRRSQRDLLNHRMWPLVRQVNQKPTPSGANSTTARPQPPRRRQPDSQPAFEPRWGCQPAPPTKRRHPGLTAPARVRHSAIGLPTNPSQVPSLRGFRDGRSATSSTSGGPAGAFAAEVSRRSSRDLLNRRGHRSVAFRPCPTRPPLLGGVGSGRRRSRWVIAMAVGVGLGWLPFAGRSLSPDEAGYLIVGGQWAEGSSLYGDFWVDRPPVLIAIFEAADALGGAVPLRLIGALAAVLTVILSGVLGRIAAPERRSAPLLTAGTAAVCVATPLFGGRWSTASCSGCRSWSSGSWRTSRPRPAGTRSEGSCSAWPRARQGRSGRWSSRAWSTSSWWPSSCSSPAVRPAGSSPGCWPAR